MLVDPLFSVDHVLSCLKGDLYSLRHHDIRDLTVSILFSGQWLNQSYNLSVIPVGTPSLLLILRIVLAMNRFWSWGGQSEKCSGYSIILLLLISASHCLLPTGNTKTLNAVLVNLGGGTCFN